MSSSDSALTHNEYSFTSVFIPGDGLCLERAVVKFLGLKEIDLTSRESNNLLTRISIVNIAVTHSGFGIACGMLNNKISEIRKNIGLDQDLKDALKLRFIIYNKIISMPEDEREFLSFEGFSKNDDALFKRMFRCSYNYERDRYQWLDNTSLMPFKIACELYNKRFFIYDNASGVMHLFAPENYDSDQMSSNASSPILSPILSQILSPELSPKNTEISENIDSSKYSKINKSNMNIFQEDFNLATDILIRNTGNHYESQEPAVKVFDCFDMVLDDKGSNEFEGSVISSSSSYDNCFDDIPNRFVMDVGGIEDINEFNDNAGCFSNISEAKNNFFNLSCCFFKCFFCRKRYSGDKDKINLLGNEL